MHVLDCQNVVVYSYLFSSCF